MRYNKKHDDPKINVILPGKEGSCGKICFKPGIEIVGGIDIHEKRPLRNHGEIPPLFPGLLFCRRDPANPAWAQFVVFRVGFTITLEEV